MSSSKLPLFRRDNSSINPRSVRSWVVHITRKRVLIVFFIIASFLFLRSVQKDRNFDSKTIPTPYRIDWPSWPVELHDEEINKSAFEPSLFTPNALYQEEDLKQVTAVIYRVSKNPQDIVSVIHHLLRYPFIKEIYIHNPIGAPSLVVEQLDLNANRARYVNIDVFDEKNERLGSLARFTTCAMATYDSCYMQDDTWQPQSMDSLYLNMIRYPNLIHANSPPLRYLDQMRWRVSNPDFSMHAGFADLQYGAFVPRWKVQTFMTQLGKSALGKDRIRLADMYFSIWTNQYPWILSNPLLLASGSVPDPREPLPPDLYSNIHQAVRRLQRTLEADLTETPKDYFERVEDEPRLYERDVRASCGNDRCLFITNMDHAPSPTLFKYDKDNFTGIPHIERTYNELMAMPSTEFWNEHAYHKAVDSDPNSCWNSYTNPKAGDYFGMIMMGKVLPKLLQIYTCNDIRKPENLFDVSVTNNGTDWISCKTRTMTPWQQVPPRISIRLDCGETIEYIRAIRMTFLEDGPEPFNVCGFALDTVVV